MSPRDRRAQNKWDWLMTALFVVFLLANAAGAFGD